MHRRGGLRQSSQPQGRRYSLLAALMLAALVADAAAALAPALASTFLDRPGRRAADAGDPCARAVGQILVDGDFNGTGAVVAHARVVLTNAHVVAEDGRVRRRVRFRLPARTAAAAFGKAAAVERRGTVVAVGAADPARGGRHAKDWALVVLDAPVPDGVQPLRVVADTPEHSASSGRPLALIGFHDDIGDGEVETISAPCTADAVIDGRLTHDCAMMHGASGAPLLDRDGGETGGGPRGCRIVGINLGAFGSSRTDVAYSSRPGPRLSANQAVPAAAFRNAVAEVAAAVESGIPADRIRRARRHR